MLIPRGTLSDLWREHGAVDRPVVPPSTDREAWTSVAPELRATILAAADGERRTAWAQPLLSQWAAYARTGDRAGWEGAVFRRDLRLRRAVLAAAVDPVAERLDEVADGLWLLAEQSTWCWPAHDDAFARGRRVPDIERPVLDLGAGEAAALAGWAVLVLGEDLDAHAPGLVARVRDETVRRVLRPFVDRREWAWEGSEERVHNWAPWIHGNLLPAALAFADEPLRARVLALSIDGLDRYLAQLPADGGIDEGFAYWWQGAGRAFDALGLLDALTAGAVAAAIQDGRLAGLRELALFPERVQLGEGWVASFSDAEARTGEALPWSVLHRAAVLCGLEATAAFAARHRRPGRVIGDEADVVAGLGRTLAELFDADWHAARPGPAPLPGRVEFTSLGVGLRRERSGDPRGLAVVVKGGRNDENHNHNDLGAVAIAVDGVPVVIDVGRATYTAATFSDARYRLWHVTSGWHSTPLVRGREQQPGGAWRAAVQARSDGWTLDLGTAFPGGDPWWRTVLLRGGAVTVRDESPALADPATRLVLVCAGTPEVHGDGVLLPGPDGKRGLRIAHDPADVVVESRAVDDTLLERSWGPVVSRVLFAPLDRPERWELQGRAA
ncbi:heparinase II/III family protein [Microbacterium sp. LEMMJ01]|uniref:heparinase II/III family protein n=1 Tax=Microbacterium sp. LEMMJ01 TaxID=1978350 RepID=UPI000A1DB565|nr:heparinase II/III family protein [Microbacterium sp. LEMMJ01]OSP07170.1 hypothetical protein B7W94_08600 [Microbacterium sp. LEMMJ01]